MDYLKELDKEDALFGLMDTAVKVDVILERMTRMTRDEQNCVKIALAIELNGGCWESKSVALIVEGGKLASVLIEAETTYDRITVTPSGDRFDIEYYDDGPCYTCTVDTIDEVVAVLTREYDPDTDEAMPEDIYDDEEELDRRAKRLCK